MNKKTSSHLVNDSHFEECIQGDSKVTQPKNFELFFFATNVPGWVALVQIMVSKYITQTSEKNEFLSRVVKFEASVKRIWLKMLPSPLQNNTLDLLPFQFKN